MSAPGAVFFFEFRAVFSSLDPISSREDSYIGMAAILVMMPEIFE